MDCSWHRSGISGCRATMAAIWNIYENMSTTCQNKGCNGMEWYTRGGITSNIGTDTCNMAQGVTYLTCTAKLVHNCDMESMAKICGTYRKIWRGVVCYGIYGLFARGSENFKNGILDVNGIKSLWKINIDLENKPFLVETNLPVPSCLGLC